MDRLFIVKIGGNVLDDAVAQERFLRDFADIQGHRLLVHGGGKIATSVGNRLGIESKYVNGRRITDAQTLDLVTMVYGGLVNKQIVARLQGMSCNAIGVTGADGNLIQAVKRTVKEVDYGFAGDVTPDGVNVRLLKSLLDQEVVPVFAPLTHDSGHMLNTNADTIASVLAIALSAWFDVRLIFCFEKKGVLRDVSREDSVIHHLPEPLYRTLLDQQAFADGILPKLENAYSAIHSGVKEVLIGDAGELIRNTGREPAGTLITR